MMSMPIQKMQRVVPLDHPAHAQALIQVQQIGAATQHHVLAIVQRKMRVRIDVARGPPPQSLARLQQRHAPARLRKPHRRRDPGQPAPHHQRSPAPTPWSIHPRLCVRGRYAHRFTSASSAITSFRAPVTRGARLSTTAGSREMCVSKFRYTSVIAHKHVRPLRSTH